ncbi:MAG: ATP-binding cassette domain-containing protein [Patescibacteria group bacterium]|nr:ATP-binding cassette domain-containing protein [Patescibacteria group bacterium]
MHPILTLVGPSGSGKSTLIKALIAKYPDRVEITRSLTTRPKRNEEDDLFYTFTTPEDIKRRQAEGKLTHYAEYAGNLYATDREELTKILNHKIAIAALVEDGVRSLRKAGFEVVVIKIRPQTTDNRRQELEVRGDEERRRKADRERAQTDLEADYEIVNSFETGGLERAIGELEEIIEELTN